MRIGLVFGHVATNLGDLAINVGVAEILAQAYPDARLTVALLKPNADLLQEAKACFKSFGQVDFEVYGDEPAAHKLFEVEQMQQIVEKPERFFAGKGLLDCDVVFFNSGEHVFHYSTGDVNVDLLWRLTFLVSLSRLGKKTLCLPSTLGPFEGSVGRKVKQAFNQSLGAVFIRELSSWENEVTGSEWLERSAVSLDPAFYIPVTQYLSGSAIESASTVQSGIRGQAPVERLEQDNARVLGLVPRLEAFGLRVGARKSSEYSRMQAQSRFKHSPSYQACCDVIEQARANGFTQIRVFVQTLADKKLALQLAEDFSVVEVSYPASLDEYFVALAQCQAVVAMRFHACIFCMLLRVPVFGVYFSEHGHKVPGLFNMLDSQRFCDGRALAGNQELSVFISDHQQRASTLPELQSTLDRMRAEGIRQIQTAVVESVPQTAAVPEQNYLLKQAFGKLLTEWRNQLNKHITDTKALLDVARADGYGQVLHSEHAAELQIQREKSLNELLGDEYYEQRLTAQQLQSLTSELSEKRIEYNSAQQHLQLLQTDNQVLKKNIRQLVKEYQQQLDLSDAERTGLEYALEQANEQLDITRTELDQVQQQNNDLHQAVEAGEQAYASLSQNAQSQLAEQDQQHQATIDVLNQEMVEQESQYKTDMTQLSKERSEQEANYESIVAELNGCIEQLKHDHQKDLTEQKLKSDEQLESQQLQQAALLKQVEQLESKVNYFKAKVNTETRRLRKSRRFRIANDMANALNSKYGVLALLGYCIKLVLRRLRPKTYFVAGLKKRVKSLRRNAIAKKNKVIRSRINQAISLFEEMQVDQAQALAEQTFKDRASKRALLLLIEIAYFRSDFKVASGLRQQYLDLFEEPSWNHKVMFNDILYYQKMIAEVESWDSLPATIDPEKVDNGAMYVLHSCTPYLSGGYAQRGHGLIKGMQKNGWKVTPVTRPGFPSDVKRVFREMDLPQSEEIDGVTYQKLDQGLRRGRCEGEYMYQSISHYEAAIERLGSAVVQGRSTYLIALPALIAAVRKGVPFVYEMSGLWEITFESRMQEPNPKEQGRINRIKYLEALIANKAQQVFTLTRAMRAEIASRGVPEEKILLCPNSVDPEHFSSFQDAQDKPVEDSSKPVTIGYVGSFVDYEGLDYLLQAARRLKDEGLNFKLLMVGDGAEFDRLVKLAETLKLGESVEFTGRVSQAEVVEYYKTIDICPFPRKGWRVCEMVSPLKPFEALAMGKPIVVSSVGALSEFIKPGENGLVFEKDNVESLYLNLKALIEDGDTRTRIGRNARHWVETERNWVNTSKVITETFERLLSHKQ